MNRFLKLGKFSISVPVSLTGFLGYFLARPAFDPDALYTVLGIFLLSSGSSALNQIQERHTDARMERTAKRPLPARQITLRGAILFSVICATSGTILLLLTGYPLAAVFGVFTLLWYNLVYTPLKKITAFAVLPGALIGAMPPLIGWTAAGRDPLDMEILAVAFLLFVGQMPHYWLLMLKVGKEFQKAGIPVITSLLDERQIRNLSFVWIATTGACVMMLPATPVIRHRGMSLLMIVAAIWFIVRMFRLSYRRNLVEHWKKAFITVNLFYLLLILVLIADRMI
ncbi:MAG: protoheme IX farnesyltransferase [Bacteroidales bacterium]|nr:protoheme IX farnesyltransferase [Bacteroidales bacterium]